MPGPKKAQKMVAARIIIIIKLVLVSIPMCVGVPHTSKQNLGTTARYPAIQLNSEYLPGDSTKFHRFKVKSTTRPPPPHMSVSSPGCYLCFWGVVKVPRTPSLGSNNLLQWLTEHREIFYLLDHKLIIIKGEVGGRQKSISPLRRKFSIGLALDKEILPNPSLFSLK